MRQTTKIINQTVSQEITTIVTHEDIIEIFEQKEVNNIGVGVGLYSEDGTLIEKEYYVICGDNYTNLMSLNPEFAPGKPENEYREIDLWYMIDLIRSST